MRTSKIAIIGFIIIVLVVSVFASFNKQLVKRIGLVFKWGKASAEANIDYQEQRKKEDDKYNYNAKFYSPVGAKVSVNTMSSDTVAVTSVKQKGKQTVIILEPVNE